MVVLVSQPCSHDAPTPGRVDKEYVTGLPRVAEVICGKTAAEIAGAVMARLPGPLVKTQTNLHALHASADSSRETSTERQAEALYSSACETMRLKHVGNVLQAMILISAGGNSLTYCG